MSMEMSGYSRSFGIDVVFRGAYGFLPISSPRNIELGSGAWNDNPNSLWPEDYDEVTATLIHIVTGNKFK